MGFYFLVMAGFCVAAILTNNLWLAAGEALATLLMFGFYMLRKQNRHRQLQKYIQSVSGHIESISHGECPFPMVMVRLGDGGIVWANEQFISITGFSDTMMVQTLHDVLPAFSTDWLSDRKTEAPYDVELSGRRYRVYGTTHRANDPGGTMMGVLYFSDLTMLYQVRDEYIRSRPVVSIILIDNYEELTKNLNEGAISSLNARINDVITEWTEEFHGMYRKLERNRYLFVFEKRHLNDAIEDKFSLVENMHQVVSPTGLSASLSVGLGVDGANFEETYNFAALSIEMALSRGGDQAVIKDRFNFNFFGGRNQEADYRSKVRSRVTANSLMELIGQSSQVFIMGHKNADLDSVGAAMGISCLCRKKGKKAYIVLDLEKNASKQLLSEILVVPEYQNVFISGQDALLLCDNHSTLVVVDTNRPAQVECQPLLETISKVCVIDHHRRAADYIDPVVVNLHEPYASSASELTTELLQYAVDPADVLPIEVKSLLAGIFLDTKSFNVRTGERTFEAAAFLRRLGADTVEVKKLLQNDFQDTVAKYQIIKSARLYRQELAIAALNSATTRVLAAQAADELLNISGITASFVLYPDGDTVIISARSLGNANVQMILEPLGGGGNTATAGAQVKDSTVKEVLDRLVASIDKYYED
ncbi:MAG: DHH family phosphoesterase [Oscillospiraceae bacterium]|nr:DHH family phosphoesterase [Oscillospiraceae bacterium]